MKVNQANGKLFDSIRNRWVADEPEERVRQGLIRWMIEELGYPKELLVVEKALDQLPHLETYGEKIPDRRVDLLCFASGIHPDHSLYPLLMIECKAVPLTEAVKRQVIGYNRYVQAPFVAIVNQFEMQTGFWTEADQKYQFTAGLPTYNDLRALAAGNPRAEH